LVRRKGAGHSINAVKTQIWCAVCTYVLVAIIKKRLAVDASMHAILQVLSLSLFEATSLDELFGNLEQNNDIEVGVTQLRLFPEISGQ
jgi:hypothetical protein